eukprot:4937473-Pleurochrysis_carterae.AAC.3
MCKTKQNNIQTLRSLSNLQTASPSKASRDMLRERPRDAAVAFFQMTTTDDAVGHMEPAADRKNQLVTAACHRQGRQILRPTVATRLSGPRYEGKGDSLHARLTDRLHWCLLPLKKGSRMVKPRLSVSHGLNLEGGSKSFVEAVQEQL